LILEEMILYSGPIEASSRRQNLPYLRQRESS
jgi:hypothetical protein